MDKHVKTMNRIKSGGNKSNNMLGWEYIPPELMEVQSTVSQQQAEEVCCPLARSVAF